MFFEVTPETKPLIDALDTLDTIYEQLIELGKMVPLNLTYAFLNDDMYNARSKISDARDKLKIRIINGFRKDTEN